MEMSSQTALRKSLLVCRFDLMQEWPYHGVQPLEQVLISRFTVMLLEGKLLQAR